MPLISYQTIPRGNSGIKVSVGEIGNLIKQYRKDYDIINLANRIVSPCPNKDYNCEIKRIFNFVKLHIRYTRDPYRVELLRSPAEILRSGHGDCDCHTILLQSLLQAIGFPTRSVVIAGKPQTPQKLSHIYAEVFVGDKWTALDTTVARSFPGWKPQSYGIIKIYPVEE